MSDNEISKIEKETRDQIKAHYMAQKYYLDFKKQFENRKIIAYKSITNDKDNPDFDEAVNNAIKDGWQPIGGQAVVYNEIDQCWDAWQAMVKYE